MDDPKILQRYATGGLLAFALRECQIHQLCVQNFCFPSDDITMDYSESELWINRKFGLLRPVFRLLKIDSKAWRGIEETALTSPALNHVGALLKTLSLEEENGKSSSSFSESNIEDGLIKAVDALATALESKMASHSPPQFRDGISGGVCQSISGLESGSQHRFNQMEMIKERKLLTERRRKLVLYELLAACVLDTHEDDKKPTIFRRGYDARHRVALRFLAKLFDINWTKVVAMEVMLACSIKDKIQEGVVEENDTNSQDDKWSKWKHGGMIGVAALTGGALLAISGGLAAPAIAQGLIALAPALGTIVPIVNVSGFTALVSATTHSMVGSIAIASSFGAAGASLSGKKMARRIGGVDEFRFIPIGENHKQGCLAVGIMISGSILTFNDFTRPWIEVGKDLERSDKAGVLLAQSLLSIHRPVTLIGFSLGARVIFRCLEELSKKCESARIVERVVLLGAPIPLDMERWKIARKVLSHISLQGLPIVG